MGVADRLGLCVRALGDLWSTLMQAVVFLVLFGRHRSGRVGDVGCFVAKRGRRGGPMGEGLRSELRVVGERLRGGDKWRGETPLRKRAG
jgi:hypothetical protein